MQTKRIRIFNHPDPFALADWIAQHYQTSVCVDADCVLTLIDFRNTDTISLILLGLRASGYRIEIIEEQKNDSD